MAIKIDIPPEYKYIYIIPLILIIALSHLVINFYIVNNSQIVRVYDESDRICEGIVFYNNLINHEYEKTAEFFTTLQNDYHPKLFSLVQGLVLIALDRLGAKNIDLTVLISNFIFLTILLFSIYEIGKLKYNGNIGLLTAILISLCPIIFEASRLSMLDLPLTAIVALGLMLLLKTEKLISFFYSFCTGIIFGIAQLTKETAIIFILPPFIYYLFYSHRDTDRMKIRIANFSVIALLYLIVSAPIYLNPVNRYAFYTYWRVSFLTHHQSDFFHYLKNPEYFGILFAFLLLPLISYLIKINNRDLFLTICFLVPLIIFSFSVLCLLFSVFHSLYPIVVPKTEFSKV